MIGLIWRILKTETRKEGLVAKSLEDIGAQTFIPHVWKLKTISIRAKRFGLILTPAIPKIVFFSCASSIADILAIRHSKGLAATQGGSIWSVSDRQMRHFQEGLADDHYGDGTWLPITADEKKAWKQRERDRTTARSLADLERLAPQLFGA